MDNIKTDLKDVVASEQKFLCDFISTEWVKETELSLCIIQYVMTAKGEGGVGVVAPRMFILCIKQYLSHYIQTWILGYIFI